MKFRISREDLLKPLQMVCSVVEKRQTLPILSNVLVQAEKGKLKLVGTDLEVELMAVTSLQDAEDGDITLPARKFVDICRTLPDAADITISVNDGKATVRSGRSRFTLATLPASEYPAAENVIGAFEFSVAQKDLKKLLEQTQFCMANQDVRYYLNGLLLEVDSKSLRTVATDGHRLALCETSSTANSSEKQQIIIPRKGVVELSRLLTDSDGNCDIKFNNNQIKFSLDGVTLTSKLIDGRFPDYDRVIPSEAPQTITADRETLRQALVRASILSNEKYRGIRLQLENNRIRAFVNNPEQEEAEEEIEVQYQGDEFEIGFNVSYLLDALNAVKQDQVELSMIDANSSCRIKGVGDDSSQYVVMPMRL